MAETLYDMHCHLGFAANVADLPSIARAARLRAFSCTVTPGEFERFALSKTSADAGFRMVQKTESALGDALVKRDDELDGNDGAGGTASSSPLVWGLGLHPWYVTEEWRAQAKAFENQLEKLLAGGAANSSPLGFGELGLDFSQKHRASAGWQVAALTQLLGAIVKAARTAPTPPLLSLHAVQSADTVLELLAKTGAFSCCRIIFHWFSGSGEELTAARKEGCYFSVGPHMLASRRGRAYGAQIPERQLLLETDEPPEGAIMAGETWRGQLEGALDQLAQLRKADPAQLSATISATSRGLLHLPSA